MQADFITKIFSMKYLSIATIIIATIITSCANNSSKDLIYKPKSGDSINVSSNDQDTSGIIPSNNSLFPVSPGSTTTNSLPVGTSEQPITTTGAGLNPEHGKPGHRCDIAVGAPLNSTTTQTIPSSTPTITNTPSISPQAPMVTPQASNPVAKGMNPEHGKPGHRCDIGVGEPLDSKPAEIKAEVPTTTKTDAPVTPLLPSTSKPVAAGMNPEHGKPGHRCDIGVGEPLPKQ